MSLHDQKEIDAIVKHVRGQTKILEHNAILFDIYEGDLLTHVLTDLHKQLNPQSFDQVKHRVSPINILKKIIDKLSKIYQQGPSRTVVDGSDMDSELLAWYEKNMRVDQKMNIGNEFFNLWKYNLNQIFLNKGIPSLRPVPNHRFTVWSVDEVDPTKPTHIILIMGDKVSVTLGKTTILHVYTDDEFMIINMDGQIEIELMKNLPEDAARMGINPFGVYPFTYTNRSQNLLIPLPDSDTLTMTKLIPVLLSDLNYAVMFQAFSIIWGIDVDDENLKMAPNSFWRFKSDESKEGKPQIGVIKPQVDITEVLGLIQGELAFWLNSRGIRPGAIGSISTENFASGISKMVDEMDSADDRKKQVEFYKDTEIEMWDKIFKNINPYWVSKGMIENTAQFTATAEVVTNFAEQLPLLKRGDMVADLRDEVAAGFLSKRDAIKKLNPHMTDKDLDEHILLIEEERNGGTFGDEETKGQEEKTQGTTGIGGPIPHTHGFSIDAGGNGATNSTSAGPEHTHQIVDNQVQPAGAEDHTHPLGG